MCKLHETSTSSNKYHDSDECRMLEESGLGPNILDLTEDSLVHACIFLARMWKIKKDDSALFENLYFQMDGDTNDIVSQT